jgi:hypothetical protein
MNLDEFADEHRTLILFVWLIMSVVGLYLIVWWDERENEDR